MQCQILLSLVRCDLPRHCLTVEHSALKLHATCMFYDSIVLQIDLIIEITWDYCVTLQNENIMGRTSLSTNVSVVPGPTPSASPEDCW